MNNFSSHLQICTQFSAASFASHLRTSQIGRFLIYRQSINSTQNIAKREIVEGGPTGTVILAEEQTAGRGRVEGRTWRSENAGNLFFSLILRPKNAELLTSINLSIAIAVAESINQLFNLDATVKWPNDVWIRGKKVSGTLIDAEFIGSSIGVAAGIGINVNEDWTRVTDHSINQSSTSNQSINQSATSIRTALSVLHNRVSGEQPLVDRELVLASVCNRLEQLLTLPFSSILERYIAIDCLINQSITVMPKKVEDPASHYQAIAVGYNDQGYLMVKRNDSETPYPLIAEEVTVRLK